MPACQGLPSRSCPHNKCDASVELCQGDLMLCHNCAHSRFPQLRDPNTTDIKQRIEVKANQPQVHVVGNNNDNAVTGQIDTGNFLDFMVYALQNSTSEHVRMAVTGHFTAGEIAEAKHALWSLCGGDVIGVDMPRRRESTTRPLAEANTHGIITPLGKLDEAEIIPNVMIDAYSLGKIPQWHPKELNQGSLADRMLRLENRVTGLQEVVDRHAAENIVTKEILDRDMSFASAVKRGQSRSPPPQSVSPPGTVEPIMILPLSMAQVMRIHLYLMKTM